MSLVVTPISEGFAVADTDNGPAVRQRYKVTGLKGPLNTWLEQAQDPELTPKRLPKRGEAYGLPGYAGVLCRAVGLERVVDDIDDDIGGTAFFFAEFARGRWGAGGRRKVSESGFEAMEEHYAPKYERRRGDDGQFRWHFELIPLRRMAIRRVETRWIAGGEPSDVTQLQSVMANAVGFIYRVGGVFSNDDYVFVGGRAVTDGVSSTRAEYEFVRWTPVEVPDPAHWPDGLYPLPRLGPFETYQWRTREVEGGDRLPEVEAVPMRGILPGEGPALPGL